MVLSFGDAAVKIVAAILGVLVVGGITAFLIPRLSRSPSRPVAHADGGGFALPDKQIEAPRGREEQLKEELTEKRLPFFRELRQQYGDSIEFRVLGDPDTLDIVVEKADTESLQSLVSNAISPSARRFGFRRVKFYTRNPRGSVEPIELRAEASYDDAGHWNLFRL
jgi:hypothetical protein